MESGELLAAGHSATFPVTANATAGDPALAAKQPRSPALQPVHAPSPPARHGPAGTLGGSSFRIALSDSAPVVAASGSRAAHTGDSDPDKGALAVSRETADAVHAAPSSPASCPCGGGGGNCGAKSFPGKPGNSSSLSPPRSRYARPAPPLPRCLVRPAGEADAIGKPAGAGGVPSHNPAIDNPESGVLQYALLPAAQHSLLLRVGTFHSVAGWSQGGGEDEREQPWRGEGGRALRGGGGLCVLCGAAADGADSLVCAIHAAQVRAQNQES
jgi:hypothetical protein